MALHRVLFYPESLVLLVSPSLRQSAELFRKIRDFSNVLSPKPKLVEDNKLSLQLNNGSRVVSLPGEEANVRGYSGVSLIIEDEASRVDDYLYRALRPMLAVSGGRMILMSTPFGKRGHFFEEWEKGRYWMRIRIPASDCPRISQTFLDQEKESIGEWWYKQEYCCQFVETEDQFFSHDEIMRALDDEITPLQLY